MRLADDPLRLLPVARTEVRQQTGTYVFRLADVEDLAPLAEHPVGAGQVAGVRAHLLAQRAVRRRGDDGVSDGGHAGEPGEEEKPKPNVVRMRRRRKGGESYCWHVQQ
jgi:hypothetical protein